MNKMPVEVIEAVAASGFDVYMRNEKDSWLIFTDGKNLAVLENNRLSGLRLATMHVPNQTTGTSFMVGDISLGEISRDKLAEAFAMVPAWASSRDRASVRKWAGIEAYQSSSSFNGEYRLVKAAS